MSQGSWLPLGSAWVSPEGNVSLCWVGCHGCPVVRQGCKGDGVRHLVWKTKSISTYDTITCTHKKVTFNTQMLMANCTIYCILSDKKYQIWQHLATLLRWPVEQVYQLYIAPSAGVVPKLFFGEYNFIKLDWITQTLDWSLRRNSSSLSLFLCFSSNFSRYVRSCMSVNSWASRRPGGGGSLGGGSSCSLSSSSFTCPAHVMMMMVLA